MQRATVLEDRAVTERTVEHGLAGDAASVFESARRLAASLREPGQRERYRALLERVIGEAGAVLTAPDADGEARSAARLLLVEAHAARAEDARHGAGQLSQSAQRAPTREACNDGWRRVEAIARGAETSAAVATSLAAELERGAPGARVARRARRAALRAEAAARALQRLVNERNHAYTFHADSRFSFGEGWYVAAAAVLAGIAVQIEPGRDGTPQVETFLAELGLTHRLQPYRSRPRAMKQTTELVGRAFAADAAAARAKLRAAFLGDAPIPQELEAFVEGRLAPARDVAGRRKVLLWVRDGAHQPGRNTALAELAALSERVRRAHMVPVLLGDALREGGVPEGALDLILFWKEPLFRGRHTRRLQLQFFEYLKRRHGLVGQLGATTAGMDGPALMGLPTLYLTDHPNVRMREWVGTVPGYEEIVRDVNYLARVERVLAGWAEVEREPGAE